jgi:transposase
MNRLTVSLQQSILTLHERGWSARRIARELGVHRETVGRELQRSKPAKVTTGSEPEAESKPAKVTTGSRSLCEPHRDVIETAIVQGLSAKRIYQDLKADYGYKGGYESVKRFTHSLVAATPLPFRRIETAAGEEMQVDFGQGAWIKEDDRRRRRPHVFRATLSFSRKGYSEVVWHQDTESFLRCLENAFRHFGGVSKTVVVDNLKAAVLQADWFDPELNPKLLSFALHYSTVILPTKPRTPQHKGKVEAAVKYIQDNALKGRTFKSLAEQNLFLDQWEKKVADKRIHGTVRQQVEALFAQEKPALQTLPAELFPSFHEAKRRVHRDGYVEYKKAYYSAPPEHVGREVWVRGDSKLLHIYTLQMRQIAVHTLVDQGRFATNQDHIHPHKRNAIERGAGYLLERCQLLGPHSGAWAQTMYQNRGCEGGIRVLQGLLQLARQHPVDSLEAAAEKAHRHACWRLRDLRRLIAQGDTVVQIDFLQEHELIRDLSAYRIDALNQLP